MWIKNEFSHYKVSGLDEQILDNNCSRGAIEFIDKQFWRALDKIPYCPPCGPIMSAVNIGGNFNGINEGVRNKAKKSNIGSTLCSK